MNKKVTFSLPDYLVTQLDQRIPDGAKSNFVAESISRGLDLYAGQDGVHPVDKLIDFSKKLKKANKNISQMIDQDKK